METQDSKTITAPAVKNAAQLLDWWAEEVRSPHFGQYEGYDLTLPGDNIRKLASLLFQTSGLFPDPSTAAADLSASKLVIIETIFADTEHDDQALDRLYTAFLRTLGSISAQHIPGDAKLIHAIYCSIDKEQHYLNLLHEICSFNRLHPNIEFILLPYRHPANGYPRSDSGHIDALRLPNKFYSHLALALFADTRKIIEARHLTTKSTNIRLAIDDDDVILPWGIAEMLAISEDAQELFHRKVKALGVLNQFVYYPIEGGRIDLVTWNVCMSGSKFFLSENLCELDALTPWMLPEQFSANVQRNFRQRNIDLHTVPEARPFFIYMRSGNSLSGMLKTQHYTSPASSLSGFGGHRFALETAAQLDSLSAKRKEAYSFGIDPPSLQARGKMDPETNELVITGNFGEFIASKGLDPDELVIVINYGTEESRAEISVPFSESINVSTLGWTQRAILRIENGDKDNLGSAWIRGQEPFLS